MYGTIVALILLVAAEFGLPPNFVLAVAVFNVPVESIEDIREEWRVRNDVENHVRNLQNLAWESYKNTWWQVALLYNKGQGLRTIRPSNAEIEYANGVIDRYAELEGGRINLVVGYTDEGGFY